MIFRYPGGKSRVASSLVDIMENDIISQGKFLDAFVGGGAVLLEVARRHPNVKLWANDKDPNMAAFWSMVAGKGDADVLINMLKKTPTVPLFLRLRNTTPETIEERAYRAIFFNRIRYKKSLFYS